MFAEFSVSWPVLFVLVALFIIDLMLFINEEYTWSTVIMTSAVVSSFFAFSGVHDAVLAIGWRAIACKWVPLYFVAGATTALIKWPLHTLKLISAIKNSKKEFDTEFPTDKPIADPDISMISAASRKYLIEQREEEEKDFSLDEKKTAQKIRDNANRRKCFVKYFSDRQPYDTHFKVYTVKNWTSETAVIDALSPRAKDNIGLISVWVYQWPISVVDSVLRELIIKLANKIATFFDFAFSYVTRKMVAKATHGL